MRQDGQPLRPIHHCTGKEKKSGRWAVCVIGGYINKPPCIPQRQEQEKANTRRGVSIFYSFTDIIDVGVDQKKKGKER